VFCIDGHPVPQPVSGFSHLPARAVTPVPLLAIALCGCSINLGSLSPSSEREEPEQLTSSSNIAPLTEAIKNNPGDPKAYNMRGSMLAQAGKTEEARADFNKAISLRPDNAEAYYNRGLVYQAGQQHQSAIGDFTAASGLAPQ
jgi:tetratricopeptide (TPR) repeat protein